MKSLFDPQAQAEILTRLAALTPTTQARWGTMDVAQMLAHCGQGLLMPTGELPVKAGLPILFGWMLRRIATNDVPFRHGVPTARELRIVAPRDFAEAKAHFMASWPKAIGGPACIRSPKHPFFGELTGDEWGILMFKHLDHHFRQFGV